MEDTTWKMSANHGVAIMLAKNQLSELVCDAVNLEGIAITLPEVQTLLEGITVGGHKLSDQNITLNQGRAWEKLFGDVKHKKFNLSKGYVCSLHAVAAKEEALEWGSFRTSGVVISGTNYRPPHAKNLDALFEEMIEAVQTHDDIYDQAIAIFLQTARNQFFFDVNKWMGRFMMNGHLLQNGFPVINVPAKRQLEFNTFMLAFYESGDQSQMNAFMRSCLDPCVIEIMHES